MRSLIVFSILLVASLLPTAAQWTQCNGPYGGMVSMLTASDEYIFAVSDNNTLYRSSNSGLQWIKVNEGKQWPTFSDGKSSTYFHTLFVNSNNLYAGTNKGIFISTDNGENWSKTTYDTLKFTSVYAINVQDDAIFAGTKFGLYISNNKGNTWKQTSLKNIDVRSIYVNQHYIIVGTIDQGVYKSTDNGIKWTQIGLQNNDIYSLVAQGDTIIARAENSVYRTTDNGTTWKQIIKVNGDIINPLIIHDSIIVVGSDRDIAISYNGGNSWKKIENSLLLYGKTGLIYHKEIIFVGSYNGIVASTDNGENWTWRNEGLNIAYIQSLGAHNNTIFAADSRGLYSSTNNGEQWTLLKDNLSVNSIITLGKNLFIGAWLKGVYKSTDNGINWIESGLSGIHVRYLTSNGKDIFAGAGTIAQAGPSADHGVYRSTDTGITWEHLNNGYPPNSPTCLAAHGNTVIAGSEVNWLISSTNNGDNWSYTDIIRGVPALLVNGNIFFAATWDGVYRSDDGIVWTQFTNELSKTFVHSLCSNGKQLFAGTDLGVYVSQNNGESWTSLFNGLKDIPIVELTINDNIIFAGTRNNGIWKLDLSTLSSAEEEIKTHSELTLSLSPNPNNGTLHVSLHNAQNNTPLSIELISMQGEKIVEYITNQNSFTLDINHLANGMYYVIARSGNYSTRQMLSLVK